MCEVTHWILKGGDQFRIVGRSALVERISGTDERPVSENFICLSHIVGFVTTRWADGGVRLELLSASIVLVCEQVFEPASQNGGLQSSVAGIDHCLVTAFYGSPLGRTFLFQR